MYCNHVHVHNHSSVCIIYGGKSNHIADNKHETATSFFN